MYFLSKKRIRHKICPGGFVGLQCRERRYLHVGASYWPGVDPIGSKTLTFSEFEYYPAKPDPVIWNGQ